MKTVLLMACVALSLASCATPVTPQAIGGSRSDGTVTLAYEYGLFQNPVVDWPTANASAKARCKAWGYRHAEAFGGSQNHCQAFNGYGNCIQMQVNVTYQCTK